MRKISKIYSSIPEAFINDSKSWYLDAHNFAERLSNDYKVSFDRVCGVISALSPANYWESNKAEAEKLIICFVSGGNWQLLPFRTYSANVAKAWEILTDYSRSPGTFFNPKTGAKTLNFYENIKDPKNPNFITIDRHMLGILSGNIGTRPGSQRITPKLYESTANGLKRLSKRLGLLPCELQAILWAYHLKLINDGNDG